MSAELPTIFAAPKVWQYGPHLEIHLRFARDAIAQLTPWQLGEFLRVMGIEGAYQSCLDVVKHAGRYDDWRYPSLSLGIWHLDSLGPIGVKLGPYSDPCGAYLGIPPEFANYLCGPFSWNLDQVWVTRAVMDFHSIVVGRLRELHRSIPIRSAAIHEEGWPFGPTDDTTGILIHREVARTMGLREAEDDWYACLPLE
jgi:hypothetical protein